MIKDYDQRLWSTIMINDYDQWTYLCFLRPVPAVPHTGRVWKQVTGKTTIGIDGGWDDNDHEVFVDDVGDDHDGQDNFVNSVNP